MAGPDETLVIRDHPRAVFAPRYREWRARDVAATEPRDRDGLISPSQALGCMTAAIHQLDGEPRENHITVELADLFLIANQIHDHYQDVGERMGLVADCEMVVEIAEWGVQGQIDGIIVTRDAAGNERRALLEIKTLPDWLFDEVVAAGVPLRGNLPQAMLYLKATGLTEVHFLYVDRNQLRTVELVQSIDADVMADVESWITQVRAHAKAGTYPPADDVFRPDGRCRTCTYFATCSGVTYADG